MFFILRIFICLCIPFYLSGCASTKHLTVGGDVELQTLSSSVSLTLHSAEHSMAGSGYLVYRKPDKTHIVVLSPFGTTLFEAFSLGEQIVLVYPSEKIAFVGQFNELPEKNSLKNWQFIHWVLEDAASQNKTSHNDDVIENGLVVQKNRSDGVKVYYSNRILVNGALLAHEYDLRNSKDEQLRIVLDEPQVNESLDETAFIPNLEGLKIYSLKALDQQ